MLHVFLEQYRFVCFFCHFAITLCTKNAKENASERNKIRNIFSCLAFLPDVSYPLVHARCISFRAFLNIKNSS